MTSSMMNNMNKSRDMFQLLILGLKKLHESAAFCAPVHRRFEYRVACKDIRHG